MKKAVTLAALAAVLAVMMAACEPDNPKPVDTTRGEEPVPQPDNGYAELIVGKWRETLINGRSYSSVGSTTWEFLPDGTFIPYDTVDGVRPEQDTIVKYSYHIVGDNLFITSPNPDYGRVGIILELTKMHFKEKWEMYPGTFIVIDYDRVAE